MGVITPINNWVAINKEDCVMNCIKKFISIKTLNDIEIKSDIGFIPLKNIMKTISYDVYEIEFYDGTKIECADNHIFIGEFNDEIYAIHLVDGQSIKSDDGLKIFKKRIKTDRKENMYDVQMEYHHKFYSNGVLSHNTTVVAAYLVHQMIFNEEYTIAVLANKMDSSREILSRMKLMYEELPWFLQMGVKEWNKGKIELGNKSKVISAAASSSSIRGKSVNCVDIDTLVTVKNKNTGEIESITIAELDMRLQHNK